MLQRTEDSSIFNLLVDHVRKYGAVPVTIEMKMGVIMGAIIFW